MKIFVAAILLLLFGLLITTTVHAGKKKRCYKAYDKETKTCSKALKGRYTFEDCCSKHGGNAHGAHKRRGKKKICNPCGKKESNWSEWGAWNKCNVPCGKGIIRRRRKCFDSDDQGCPGKRIQKMQCVHPRIPNCPVHGGWSDWGHWTACSTTCDKGHQLRFRTCTKPMPLYGGKKCLGAREDKRECKDLPPCPIHGMWGSWRRWSACSVTCKIGNRQRTRKCDNPKPKYNGRDCEPKDGGIKIQSCDTFKACDDRTESGSGSGMGSGSDSSSVSSGDDDNIYGDDDNEYGDDEDRYGSGKENASGSGSGEEILPEGVKAAKSNGTEIVSDFGFDNKKADSKRKT